MAMSSCVISRRKEMKKYEAKVISTTVMGGFTSSS